MTGEPLTATPMILIRLGTVYINRILKELICVNDRPPQHPAPQQPTYSARLRILDLPDDGDRILIFDKFRGERSGLNLDQVKKDLRADAAGVFTGTVDLDDC